MIRVGVVGIGMMGLTHLDVYRQRHDVQVTAVADRDAARRSGQSSAQGNIEGQTQGGFDFTAVTQYENALDLILDPQVDLVDICLPTPLHLPFAKAALEAGKHVIIEKPLARTATEALELAAVAKNSPGMAFCAMCMRFWPGWDWLKEAVDRKTYGKVLSATFRRVAQFPGGPFYSNGEACGGAILDLHIHDSDFINFLFGLPTAVTSRGYSRESGACDHVVTHYHYEQIPLVVAEGGWSMAPGFGFKMQYTVNFESATAVFELGANDPLVIYCQDESTSIVIDPVMGYEKEIDHFLHCIRTGIPSARISLESAAASLWLIESEVESLRTGATCQVIQKGA